MFIYTGAKSRYIDGNSAIHVYSHVSCYISDTRERVFHHISEHRKVSRIYDDQQSIFDEILGVWKRDEALSRAFDISSEREPTLRKQRRNNFAKKSKHLC